MKELLIIRHGRSLQNINKSDDVDSPLSHHGEHQARNVGKFLGDQFKLEWFSLYTSPFYRCLQTAEHIACFSEREKSQSKNFIVTPELREYLNHFGKEAVIPNRRGEFQNLDWGFYFEEPMTFELEQNEEFLSRMYKAYNRMSSRCVVVTHGLPALVLIHIAIHNANYIPIWDNSLSNGSITWIKDGRLIWRGRSLYDEMEYTPNSYPRDYTKESR